jgi:hypothetical protein
MVSAEAVITGFRFPVIGCSVSLSGEGGSDAGAMVDENACWAMSRALVRVATESDIRRLFDGRTGALDLELENVCARRSCNFIGRCN